MIKVNLNRTSLVISDPFVKHITHFKYSRLPDKLKAMKSIPMDTMIETLHVLRPMITDESWGLPNWAYALIDLGVSLIPGICIFLYCKYYTPRDLRYFGAIGQVRREMTNIPASDDPTVNEKLVPVVGRDITTGQSLFPLATSGKGRAH